MAIPAISTVEGVQELIDLAKEARAARRRREDEELSQDEIAFYDALAVSASAVDTMGTISLKVVIAHELLISLTAVFLSTGHTAKMRVLPHHESAVYLLC